MPKFLTNRHTLKITILIAIICFSFLIQQSHAQRIDLVNPSDEVHEIGNRSGRSAFDKFNTKRKSVVSKYISRNNNDNITPQTFIQICHELGGTVNKEIFCEFRELDQDTCNQIVYMKNSGSREKQEKVCRINMYKFLEGDLNNFWAPSAPENFTYILGTIYEYKGLKNRENDFTKAYKNKKAIKQSLNGYLHRIALGFLLISGVLLYAIQKKLYSKKLLIRKSSILLSTLLVCIYIFLFDISSHIGVRFDAGGMMGPGISVYGFEIRTPWKRETLIYYTFFFIQTVILYGIFIVILKKYGEKTGIGDLRKYVIKGIFFSCIITLFFFSRHNFDSMIDILITRLIKFM